MWTADDIKARFAEAADVERRSPRGQWGPSQKLSYWPEYQQEFSDQTGWSGQTWQDIYEARNRRRVPPSSIELSRADEVLFEWTPLVAEDRRKLVWFWVHSAAGGVKFAVVCRRMGWVRRTAYDRLDRLFEQLAARFNNDGLLWGSAGDIGSCTLSASGSFNSHTLAQSDLGDMPSSPRSWSDGSATSDNPEIRDFSWAQHQAERRARIEAKKRRKLGLEPAPVGA